jgi:hypothetical protein
MMTMVLDPQAVAPVATPELMGSNDGKRFVKAPPLMLAVLWAQVLLTGRLSDVLIGRDQPSRSDVDNSNVTNLYRLLAAKVLL